MDERFIWRAEIEFHGTAAEFNRLGEALQKLRVEIHIPEWVHDPCHFAGCMRVPVLDLLGEERLKQLAEGMPRVQIKYIQDIFGGIRTPHFHFGDDVVLLDRARFKTFVGQVAQELAGRRAEGIQDYIEVMQPVSHLVSTLPIPLP